MTRDNYIRTWIATIALVILAATMVAASAPWIVTHHEIQCQKSGYDRLSIRYDGFYCIKFHTGIEIIPYMERKINE